MTWNINLAIHSTNDFSNLFVFNECAVSITEVKMEVYLLPEQPLTLFYMPVSEVAFIIHYSMCLYVFFREDLFNWESF